MAEIVRRRSWGGVLPLGRHVSISGSSLIQCASVSMAPPHPGWAKCYPGAKVQGRTGLNHCVSPPISCCGTPELREGLQCLEQVGDAPQAAGEPGCHAAQDTLGLLVRASAFSGRGMVEGIPLAGGDGEVERECHDQDQ